MGVQTIEISEATTARDPRGLLAYAGAAAFAVAAAWYGLAANGVTQASAPDIGPKLGLLRGLRLYYGWWVTTLPQERLYTVIAIAGFCCLAAVAIFIRDALGRDRAIAGTGAIAVTLGAVLWITGSAAQLGGHRAVGQMATHANPIQAVNSIAFTIDRVASAITLAAFLLIGAGLLAIAADPISAGPASRAWAGYTALVGFAMLVISASYALGAGNLTDFMLLLSGVVLVPVWLVMTRLTWGSPATSPALAAR